MSHPPGDALLHWYVLLIEPRREQAVADALDQHGLRSYLPKYTHRRARIHGRHRKDVQRPLIPGYLLVGLDERFTEPRFHGWAVIRGADHVRGVLGSGDGYPLRVPWQQVQAIREAEDMGLYDVEIRISAGDLVAILDGPFATFVGLVQWMRGKRIGVLARLFGTVTTVHVSVEQVRKVDATVLTARELLAYA